MGMAASQARLLSITARISDNELRSQTINNAKMRLATQSSQASENYINALNDADLMFSNYDETGAEKNQLLTFNALTAYSSYNNQYGLVNSSGQLLVSESEAKMFEASNGNINAYLKSHGLEFTTTYFDNVGNLENPEYPVPFKIIEADTLKEMYEASGSYENSLEVATHDKYYSAFVAATDELRVSSQEILKSYMCYEGNSPKIRDAADGLQIDISGNSMQLAQAFKSAFLSSTNTYGIDSLKNVGLTDAGYQEVLNLINSVGYEGTTVGTISLDCAVSYGKNDEDGTESCSIICDYGEISVYKDKDGKISVSQPSQDPDDEDASEEFTFTYSSTATSIREVINSFQITDADQNINFRATTNSNGGLDVDAVHRYPTSTITFNEALNDLANNIFDIITAQEESFSYTAFASTMLEWNELGTNFSDKGIDINKVLTCDKTYIEVLENYQEAKDNYLGFIETNYEPSVFVNSPLEDLLDSGELTITDMKDVDKILKALNKHDIPFTNNYKTVVSEYIVGTMIADKGEPKYAWVDENDTTNTGNADAKAQWYTNMFNRMKQGYKVLENGLASSAKWIEYAMESGIVTMEQVDKSFNWKSLDYKTCSRITEQTDSSDVVAKAEAEYNRAMKDIDAKDSVYDIELKNIDTEHTALQTEYESIKTVISKNIDRTFKFNQNG